jgi:drug/metabolite transporter (DMT)-like permease
MNSQNKTTALMVFAMFCWAASWPIAKILSNYLTVNEVVFYRYFLTSISMIFVLKFMNLDFKINFKNLILAIISGVFLVAYTRLFFLGVKFGEAGFSAALVTTLMPIIVYVLMTFSKQKTPSLKDYMMLVLGAFGVLVVLQIWTFDFNQIFNFAVVYLLWAALCWSLMSITSFYAKNISPIVFSFYIYIFATLVDFVVFFEQTSGSIFAMDLSFWFNFVFISIISTTFATTMYFIGVKKLTVNRASTFTFLVPFFAIVLSVIFLGESLQITTIIGAGMTIFALSVINKGKN